MKATLNSAEKPESLAAILKANLSGWYVLLALLFMSMFMSGCDDDFVVCPVDEMECATEVTAVNMLCGLGAFNSIWLQLPDGTYLQPWANETATAQLTAGARYRIGYVATERDSRYNNIITCEVALPAAQPIRLLCIKAAGIATD